VTALLEAALLSVNSENAFCRILAQSFAMFDKAMRRHSLRTPRHFTNNDNSARILSYFFSELPD
jgi:hypothetical protein